MTRGSLAALFGLVFPLAACAALGACGDSSGGAAPADATAPEASTPADAPVARDGTATLDGRAAPDGDMPAEDAGAADAPWDSTQPADAAPPVDAQPPVDASAPLDATTTPDSAPDAPADSPPGIDAPEAATVVTCPELAATNPWVDLTGSHTLADRGLVLACAHVTSYSLADVENSQYFESQIGAATNGIEVFIVQYVSEGTPGVARAVTALLYLPSGGAANVPIAAVDHPTSGLGPTCGPTHVTPVTDNLGVPLAGRGYAVVATDYGGMGVDNGMTSYLIGHAEAANTLDSVRALQQFHETRFDASQLGRDFFVMGHSQGGQAALFTHQELDASLGVNLLGSIAFAPGWGDIRLIAQDFNSASAPDDVAANFTAMALYTEMQYFGAPDGGTWLQPSAASLFPGWFHDQCVPGLLTTMEDRFAQVGDLYLSPFMLAAAACPFTAPCPGFEPWSSQLIAQQPGNFTSSAPVLLMQGGSDTLVVPESTACIVSRLTSKGTPVQACEYAADTHTTIVGSSLPDAYRWMTARRSGTTPDVCPAPLSATCN